jgi:hypothetical protein
LWPEQLPTPPARLVDELPEQDVAAAIATLSALIAKTASQRDDTTGEA